MEKVEVKAKVNQNSTCIIEKIANEADSLLGSEDCKVRKFAVEYVTKEKVIETAVSEEDDDVVKSIIERLEKEKITEEEANTLLTAKNWIIRNYAVGYASKERLVEAAVSEKDPDVAKSIINKLEKEKITEEEANTLLAAKSWIIRNYAVEYAAKEKVIEAAVSEEYADVAKSIIERLEKEKITEEEANTLLAAKSWIIRNYAVGYATKDKVLEVAISEEDDDVAESIIRRLIKEGITKEEVKKLTESYNNYISTIAKIIYKNL